MVHGWSSWFHWFFSLLLVLVGVSCFVPETSPLGAGWWVQQQRGPGLVWTTGRRHVSRPAWYLRLRRTIKHWQSRLSRAGVLWLACYGVGLVGLGWFWLLRWLMQQLMGATIVPVQYQWVLREPMAEGVGLVELQTIITVRPAWDVAPPAQASGDQRLKPFVQVPRFEGRSQSNEASRGNRAEPRWVETSVTGLRLTGQPDRSLSLAQLEAGPTPPQAISPEQRAAPAEPPDAGPAACLAALVPAGLGSIRHHFAGLTDPRVERTKRHQLLDLVTLTICAVIGGADNWVEVANFGRAKLAWFQQFLALPNGIPSHDTFGRVFARLDDQQFEGCFLAWIGAVQQITAGQVIALDGKTLRRSHDRTTGQGPIHLVSAWATANRLVLGQLKVDQKSNEITAIPQLLTALAMAGCIVTIDAMGCQKKIAHQIIAQQADYVLAVKENQAHLYADIKELFAYAHEINFKGVKGWDYQQTVDKGHGRIDIRECWTLTDPEFLFYLRNRSAWTGLHTLVMVKAQRRVGEQTRSEVRYYISSLPGQAAPLLEAVRSHWGIENQLHWILDVAFREDDNRCRKGHSAQNFAIIRHIALNLLGHETSAKCGIKAKRLQAGWDENYLRKVLAGPI